MSELQSALILEDHSDTLQWLDELLHDSFPGIKTTGAPTIEQALIRLNDHKFDLALIDINLPDGNGIDIISHLKASHADTFCVVTTIFDDDNHLLSALQAGADGYLLKEQPEEQLKQSLLGILNGLPPLSPSIARKILRLFQSDKDDKNESGLSPREIEILTLIAKGLGRKEISGLLSISPNTVATHISAVYRKLDISSRAEATLEAIRLGLVRP